MQVSSKVPFRLAGAPVWLLLLTALLIGAPPALAYDGNEDVMEGWTYRVCGLKEAGRSSAPARSCPERSCATSHEYREGDLLFTDASLETLKKAGLHCRGSSKCDRPKTGSIPLRVTKVEVFTVFLKPDKHKAPFGYAESKFLCDDARPK